MHLYAFLADMHDKVASLRLELAQTELRESHTRARLDLLVTRTHESKQRVTCSLQCIELLMQLLSTGVAQPSVKATVALLRDNVAGNAKQFVELLLSKRSAANVAAAAAAATATTSMAQRAADVLFALNTGELKELYNECHDTLHTNAVIALTQYRAQKTRRIGS
jgi:hypothetical protein